MKDKSRPSALRIFATLSPSGDSATFPINYPINCKPALSRRALPQQSGPTKSKMDQNGNGVRYALRGDDRKRRTVIRLVCREPAASRMQGGRLTNASPVEPQAETLACARSR